MKLYRWEVWLLFLIVGCSGMHEQVKIAPKLKVAAKDIGGGKAVYVNVIDERGARYGSTGEVAWLFQREMEEALIRKGFQPSAKQDAQLILVIEDFQYETKKGFFQGTNRVQSRIKLVAKNNGNHYERTYQDGENIKRVFVSERKAESDIFNYVVYDVLNQVFSDEEMLKFLAQDVVIPPPDGGG